MVHSRKWKCHNGKPNPHFAKILARREAGARRSNKMGRVLFYVVLTCASATLRLDPEMAEYVVLHPENTQQQKLAAVQKTPLAPGIRQTMPKRPDQST
jgi:hypothetical protein